MKQLSDEQIDKLPWGPHEGNPVTFAEGLRDFAHAVIAEFCKINGLDGEAQPAAKPCEYNGGTCTRRACVGRCQAMQLAQSAADDKAGGKPVAAQQRFRRPEKGVPNWSAWQQCTINKYRPSYEIDSQGWQVEYRLLYARPQPQAIPPGYALVPVEPTMEMVEAAFDAPPNRPLEWKIRTYYRAMIAAAPKPGDN